MRSDTFTPTERAMLAVLSDGRPHPRGDLEACLPDALGSPANIHPHLTAIRKVLRPLGQDIICQVVNRRNYYRHIRIM